MHINTRRARLITALAITTGLTLTTVTPALAAPTGQADSGAYLRYYKLKRDLYITKSNVDTWAKNHTGAKKIPDNLAHHSTVYPGKVKITGTLKNYTVTAYNTRDKITSNIKIINGSTYHASAGILPND